MKNKDKIKRKIEKMGYIVTEINYGGRSYDYGGWDVWLYDKKMQYIDTFTGYSSSELIKNIEAYLAGTVASYADFLREWELN